MPRVSKVFFPFLSLPSPLHSPSFFLSPCPLLHSPFCWEVRIRGGGGSPAGAAARAAVEPQLLRLSKWSWWVKKSHQNGGFCSSSSPQARWQRQPSLLTHMQAPTLPSRHRRRRRTPARLHASPPHPSGSCAAHPSAPGSCTTSQPPGAAKCCRRRLAVSLPEMPFSHRSGPRALAHTCTRQRAPALKAIAAQAGTHPCPTVILLAPYLHSAKKERAKNLLQREKLITLVFSLAEWACANGQKRWGSKMERIGKPIYWYSGSIISNLLFMFMTLKTAISEQ